MAVLAVGSLLGTLATSFVPMVVARCLQGLGIGGVTAVTEIIVTEMVPLRLRGKWLALISVAWAAGTVSGPLLGGLLAEANDWSWVIDVLCILDSELGANFLVQRLIFAIPIPVCVLGLILCICMLESRHDQTDTWKSLKQIDWIGFVLFTGAIVGILVPVTQVFIPMTVQTLNEAS